MEDSWYLMAEQVTDSGKLFYSKRHYCSIFCSAGVGRTGSYIALDYLLAQASDKGVIEPFEYIKEMRGRKACMVQTDVSEIIYKEVRDI